MGSLFTYRYNVTCLGGFVAALFLACNTPGPQVPIPQQEKDTSVVVDPAKKSRSFRDSQVKADELACAVQEFNTKVHVGTPADHAALAPTTIQFTVGSYNAFKAANQASCDGVPGMAIHYGLNAATNQLSFAFSFVCMELVDDIGPYSVPNAPLYVPTQQNGWALATGALILSTWRSSLGQAFKNRIVVDEYDNNAFQNIYTNTFSHMVYKLSQIDVLIEDNHLGEQDWIEIVPVAEPEKWSIQHRGALFSLKTCLVAKNETGRMVSNDEASPGDGVFRMRGSDLGAACPPLCNNMAVFTAHGVALRNGCPP